MHFYMPPEVNGVDLMSDGETDRGLLDTLLTVLPEFGVHPFEARKECTGFIFNRVWAAIKRESLAVVAEGVARPEDVDGLFRINFGVPAGPFQMMDLVGLDVALDIENHYCDEFPHLPEEVAGPAAVLRGCRQARDQDRRGLLPLQVSDLWWSRDLHPVSGLFGSRAAASLSRFTATRRARPGLTVGSTLDGGPNWADDARSVCS